MFDFSVFTQADAWLAMAFSLAVELINIRMRKSGKPASAAE